MKALSLSVLIASFAALPASAEIVTFRYTASVQKVWEYNPALGTNVVASSSMSGTSFQAGDAFNGAFSYDSDMLLSPYYQPPAPDTGTYQVYSGYIVSDLTNVRTGFTYQSDPDPSSTSMQIANNASTFYGQDLIYFSTSAPWSPTRFDMATFSFNSRDGTALDSGAIPTMLDLSQFSATVSYAYLRQSDGNQMHADAVITSLSKVVLADQMLPEPGSMALLVAGFLGIAGLRRKTK